MKTIRELIEDDTALAESIEAAQESVRACQAIVRDFEDDRQNLRQKMAKLIPHWGRRRALVKLDDGKIAVVSDNSSNNQDYAVEIEISEVV